MPDLAAILRAGRGIAVQRALAPDGQMGSRTDLRSVLSPVHSWSVYPSTSAVVAPAEGTHPLCQIQTHALQHYIICGRVARAPLPDCRSGALGRLAERQLVIGAAAAPHRLGERPRRSI